MSLIGPLRRFPPLEPWEDLAACRQVDDPSIFDDAENEEAREICEGCPVREECLEFAIREDMNTGIWGGLNETERKKHARGLVA